MNEVLLRLLAISAYRYYSAALIGSPPPYLQEERNALRTYVPGDYVMEISTIWDREQDTQRIGRFIVTRKEVVPYESEEDAALNDHEVLYETYTYLELLDGSLFRWHNCMFIRVFEYLHSDLQQDSSSTLMDYVRERSAWAEEAIKRHGL